MNWQVRLIKACCMPIVYVSLNSHSLLHEVEVKEEKLNLYFNIARCT